MRTSTVGASALILCALLAGCGGGTSVPAAAPVPLPAFQVDKGAGNFYASFAGPQRPSLNALKASGKLSASSAFIFTAVMAGNVADGNTNYYVWGINRGGATNAPFLGEPNVSFDSVVVVTVAPDGTATGAVNLLPGGNVATLPAGSIAISGSQMQFTVPTAPLPPKTGFTAAGFTWNLWPRAGVGGAQSQIASFIPENAMVPFLPAP